MKEEVYYLKIESGYFVVPAELSVGGMAHTIETPERHNFYLPKRGLELSGLLTLPFDADFSEIDEGKIRGTVQLTKETLKSPSGIWEARKLQKIPKETKSIRIDKKKIDRIMISYEEYERANEEFGKEFSEFKKKHPNLPQSFNYEPKVNPFEYDDKFYLECDRAFLPFIKPDKKIKFNIKLKREYPSLRTS